MTNATWKAHPANGNYRLGSNWVQGHAPDGNGIGYFGASSITSLSIAGPAAIVTLIQVGGWTFTPGAPAYTFTINGGAVLLISGAGIVNHGSSPRPHIINNNFLGFGGSSAGKAIITNNSDLYFTDTGRAGTATITNNDTMVFKQTGRAGHAVITNNHTLEFNGLSYADSATIITKAGGTTSFHDSSDGGSARFVTQAGGLVDFSDTLGPDGDAHIHVGSIAGAGTYHLGSAYAGRYLFVGGNNLSTEVSGAIDGIGDIEKDGAGTLKLSHNNAGLGGHMFIDGGTLDLAAHNAAGAADISQITFTNVGVRLVIENAALVSNGFPTPITHSDRGDVIDLPGLAFVAGASTSYDSGTHELSVTSGATTDTLRILSPVGDPTTLVAYFDGQGGTAIDYDNFVVGIGSNDILPATSSPDAFDGAGGTDLASYAAAPAGVHANLADPSFNTGWAAGDTYASIEGLIGSRFGDVLRGNAGPDILSGGRGKDALFGGAGADRFVFSGIHDTATGANRDVIADFKHAQADKIDLSAIDADAIHAGNQPFVFIGADTFAHYQSLHPGVIGMVRFANGIVQGNVNGDFATPEFEIAVPHITALAAGDVVL